MDDRSAIEHLSVILSPRSADQWLAFDKEVDSNLHQLLLAWRRQRRQNHLSAPDLTTSGERRKE